MGDRWEYEKRKMEIAWELASRFIPKEPKITTVAQAKERATATLHWSMEVVESAYPTPNIPDSE